MAYRIINNHFEKLPGKSVFIPRTTIVEHFSCETPNAAISPTVLFRENIDLLEVSAKKINTSQFNLQNLYAKPGTRIADRALSDTDHGLQYDMPANPADLNRVIEATLTGKDFIPTPLPSKAAVIFRWILVLVGLGLIGYALFSKISKRPS